jgi:hypothetical protein
VLAASIISIALMMVAVSTSETSVNFYRISEDSYLQAQYEYTEVHLGP